MGKTLTENSRKEEQELDKVIHGYFKILRKFVCGNYDSSLTFERDGVIYSIDDKHKGIKIHEITSPNLNAVLTCGILDCVIDVNFKIGSLRELEDIVAYAKLVS